jgi:hypothetical protein
VGGEGGSRHGLLIRGSVSYRSFSKSWCAVPGRFLDHPEKTGAVLEVPSRVRSTHTPVFGACWDEVGGPVMANDLILNDDPAVANRNSKSS